MRTRSRTGGRPGGAGRRSVGAFVAVDVPGFRGRVHVREDGPAGAAPLVMLHGFSGSLHWFDRVVPLLADRFRLIRIDLLAHGSTGGPALDAPGQARAVDAVLAELDITGATAVGHSFGADVAVELAERSARIERLVIVTQAPDYSDATLPRGSGVMTVPVLGVGLGRLLQAISVAVGGLVVRRRAPGPGSELAVQGLHDFRAFDVPMFRVVLVDRRDRMRARPLDAQVRDTDKPTLVILGERDHFYGARSAARYRDAGAHVHVLEDSGHSPLVELPGPTAKLIGDFARGALSDS
jgi:pimeloyl-ACP methyl ester carboxylesterase